MGTLKRLLCLFLTGVAVVTHAATIDFNELPAWDFTGETVSEETRLSDHYLSSHGVVFSSLDPYVAVVKSFAVNNANGLIGTSDGMPMFFYYETDLVTATFYNPTNPSEKRTTSQVSMEISSFIGPVTVSLTAYDIYGSPIATNSANISYTGGEMSVSNEAIHIVEFRGELCSVDSITFSEDSGYLGDLALSLPAGGVDEGEGMIVDGGIVTVSTVPVSNLIVNLMVGEGGCFCPCSADYSRRTNQRRVRSDRAG